MNGTNAVERIWMSGGAENIPTTRAISDHSNARWVMLSCIAIAVQVSALSLLGRHWFCGCGTIEFWQGTLDPMQNSQQLTDPYSFLHFGFGCGLFVWLKMIRPQWPLVRRATYAIISSVIWEVMENLPFIIQIFGAEGSGMDYYGDSIANSLGDTAAVLVGFLAASRLPTPVTVSAIVALEIVTFIMIGDSVIAGLFRITTSTSMI